jgi:hypothetical protein
MQKWCLEYMPSWELAHSVSKHVISIPNTWEYNQVHQRLGSNPYNERHQHVYASLVVIDQPERMSKDWSYKTSWCELRWP